MAINGDTRRFRMIAPAYPAHNIYSRIARSTSALGPVSVATMVDNAPGWRAEMIDENNFRRPGPRDSSGRPDHSTLMTIRPADAVGLYGGLSSTVPRLYELAAFYSDRNIPVIAGGQHFGLTNVMDALENGVDYVVLGEGEDAIVDLLEVVASGRDPATVPGIAYLKDGELVMTAERAPIIDFDRLPLPDFTLVRYARLTYFPLSWTRGCGMDCEFCTVRGKPRASSVERVVRQVAELYETFGVRAFFLVDDLFGQHRRETLKLCRLLADYQKAARVRLNITCQIRLDRARDAELLKAMRPAGINMVCIGYESPISDELEAMNKRLNPGEMLELTRLYHRAGLLIHGMFMFGYPLPQGKSLGLSVDERVAAFRRFIRRARLDTLQVLLAVPAPGTALHKRLAEQGRIFDLDTIGWEYYDGNFPVFMPDPPMTPEAMQQGVRRIMGRFYRFRSMFAVARQVLVFPYLVFFLGNLQKGWRYWTVAWRNELTRFGGWITLRKWISDFRKSPFSRKLKEAQQRLDRAR